MQKKRSGKLSSLILCMALIVAMALITTGCNGGTGNGDSGNASAAGTAGVREDGSGQAEFTQMGEGSTVFLFTVVDREGGETSFEIHTDKETVGEALVELGLIAGEESEYGLYVKTVNGITVDYDKDGVYWAFYVNDEYAPTGVSATAIAEGESYSFKVE